MSITRIGSTKEYASGWEQAFGKKAAKSDVAKQEAQKTSGKQQQKKKKKGDKKLGKTKKS